MAEDPGDTGGRQKQGVCIILNRWHKGSDVTNLKHLFMDLEYRTSVIPCKDDDHKTGYFINSKIKEMVKQNDRSAVAIVLDKSCFTKLQGIYKYKGIFKDIKQLDGKPKMLIMHGQEMTLPFHLQDHFQVCSGSTEITLPFHMQDHFQICSQAKAKDQDEESFFIEALVTTFNKYSRRYDIYELFTRVLREVEIQQYIKNGQEEHGKTRSSSRDYSTVIFETSLKSPFRFQGKSTILNFNNREDFVVTNLNPEMILLNQFPVTNNDTIEVKQSSGRVFNFVSAIIEVERCDGLSLLCYKDDTLLKQYNVTVISGVAEIESEVNQQISCLKIVIRGSGYVRNVTLRRQRGIIDLSEKKWNVHLNRDRIDPLHIYDSMLTLINDDKEIDTTFEIRPNSLSKFKLTSLTLDARYTRKVKFIWNDDSEKEMCCICRLSQSRLWEKVFIPGHQLPHYDIKKLRIDVESSNKYADLKGLDITTDGTSTENEWLITKDFEDSLTENEKTRLLCTPDKFVEVTQGLYFDLTPRKEETFRMTYFACEIRLCSCIRFTWVIDGGHEDHCEIRPSEMMYWTKVCIPNTKISSRLIKRLRISIQSKDTGQIKNLYMTASLEAGFIKANVTAPSEPRSSSTGNEELEIISSSDDSEETNPTMSHSGLKTVRKSLEADITRRNRSSSIESSSSPESSSDSHVSPGNLESTSSDSESEACQQKQKPVLKRLALKRVSKNSEATQSRPKLSSSSESTCSSDNSPDSGSLSNDSVDKTSTKREPSSSTESSGHSKLCAKNSASSLELSELGVSQHKHLPEAKGSASKASSKKSKAKNSGPKRVLSSEEDTFPDNDSLSNDSESESSEQDNSSSTSSSDQESHISLAHTTSSSGSSFDPIKEFLRHQEWDTLSKLSPDSQSVLSFSRDSDLDTSYSSISSNLDTSDESCEFLKMMEPFTYGEYIQLLS